MGPGVAGRSFGHETSEEFCDRSCSGSTVAGQICNSAMAGFNFQQMGGRCKMVSEEDAVSLLTGDIIVLEARTLRSPNRPKPQL